MTLPQVDLTITDGALGLAPRDVSDARVIIGCSSSGTAAAIVAVTNPQDAVTEFGYGPLPEAIAFALEAGGGRVYGVRGATTNAGSQTAVTATQTGDGVMAVTGSAYDSYRVDVEITVSGEAGTAKFKYSLDDGTTWSEEITVPTGAPGTYAITNTGLTLTFTDGAAPISYVDGDLFEFTCTEPDANTTNVEAALTAVMADSREWRWVHILGNSTPYSGGNTTYTYATSLKTKVEAALNQYRYTYGVCEARDIDEGVGASETEAAWITSLTAGLDAFESKRVLIAAGECELQSAVPQTGKGYMRRSIAWPAFAQRVQRPVHEDMGFLAVTGSLPGVSALYHNEDTVPGLDDARFMTARTLVGANGYFCTHGKMMALVTSDFQLNQFREVMDLACRTTRLGFLKYLNSDLRVNTDGTIDERDASRIEQYTNSILSAAMAGHCVSVSVVVDRTNNIQSTQQLLGTVRVRAYGYAKNILVDVGFAAAESLL